MVKRFLIAKLISLLLIGTAWAGNVHTFARAIARTEGFYAAGNTIPKRLHNPGDLMTQRKHDYPGQIGTYKGYAVFKNDKYGWAALEAQIQKIIDGTSAKYRQEMTMAQIGKVYAASPHWPKTLCKILKISPQLTFQEYFGLAPRVRFTYAAPMWMFDGGGRSMPVLQELPKMQARLY